MSSPEDVIKSMMADVEGGRSPEVLATFIKAQLVKPRSWLGSLLAGSNEHDHEVSRVVPFDDGGFFRQASIFEAFVRGNVLEGHVLPSGGSFGLFAIDAAGLRYLSRRRADVEAVLRAEGRSPGDCSPFVLARLLAESLLRRGNESDEVLKSRNALSNYDGGINGFGGRYEINAVEWDRIQDRVTAPAVVPDGPGWEVNFTTLHGWMHLKETLMQHRFRIGPEGAISVASQSLSRKIFKSVPSLRY
jgi:hypothetical protein